jgi:hypothetical protein
MRARKSWTYDVVRFNEPYRIHRLMSPCHCDWHESCENDMIFTRQNLSFWIARFTTKQICFQPR